MEPMERPHQFLGQLDALGVDVESPLVDDALAGGYIQVAAGGGGEEDRTVLILDFLEAAETAPLAEGFPCVAGFILIFHGMRIPIGVGCVNDQGKEAVGQLCYIRVKSLPARHIVWVFSLKNPHAVLYSLRNRQSVGEEA